MNLENLAVFSSPEKSIDYIFRLSSKFASKVRHTGLVLLLDAEDKLVGLVTDGDFRKAYSNNLNFELPISEIMNSNPITMPENLNKQEIIKKTYEKLDNSKKTNGWLRNIVVIDKEKKVVNIIDFFELIKDFEKIEYKVKIFGMGYVGLTLAVSLASKDHEVIGLDINSEIIKNLNNCKPHMYEPSLKETLQNCISNKKIKFSNNFDVDNANVYIIAVGTPLNEESKPVLNSIKSSLESIGKTLKKRDQVILRSTVPAGTTREIAIPILEDISNLKAGEDFFISFAPERTVEGNALRELRELPQIIGGLTKKCSQKASEFWSTLSGSVIQVSSLEAAELVKLANNTYRDLSFAFANEIALISDDFNINAFELIKAANDGYPRNKISFPSPGVGGYCLTKDPILFGCRPNGKANNKNLGNFGRKINEIAAKYPLKVLEKYSEKVKKPLNEMNVLIIGLAFKGTPDTKDLRGSTAVETFNNLKSKVNKISSWDAVVDNETLSKNNLNPIINLDKSSKEYDAILILNNHLQNISFNPLQKSTEYRLIFDGWDLLDASEIEKIKGQSYATMGYLTV